MTVTATHRAHDVTGLHRALFPARGHCLLTTLEFPLYRQRLGWTQRSHSWPSAELAPTRDLSGSDLGPAHIHSPPEATVDLVKAKPAPGTLESLPRPPSGQERKCPLGSQDPGSLGLAEQAWLPPLPTATVTWLHLHPARIRQGWSCETESPSRGSSVACGRLESGSGGMPRPTETFPGKRRQRSSQPLLDSPQPEEPATALVGASSFQRCWHPEQRQCHTGQCLIQKDRSGGSGIPSPWHQCRWTSYPWALTGDV